MVEILREHFYFPPFLLHELLSLFQPITIQDTGRDILVLADQATVGDITATGEDEHSDNNQPDHNVNKLCCESHDVQLELFTQMSGSKCQNDRILVCSLSHIGWI